QSGTYKAGVAGGLVVCSGCGRPLGVMGHPGRLTYSCRGSASDGRCPRRMHISKDTDDAFVDATVAGALDSRTLDVFASSRELDEAKQLLDSAQEAKAAVLAKADVLSKDELEAALQPKRQAEEAARQAYDAALTRAEETVELPKTGSAYRAL